MFRIFASVYAVLALGISVFRMASHPEQASADDFIKTMCILAVIFVMNRICKIMKTFSDHSHGAMEEQGEKQKEMLDEIVSISQAVAEESGEDIRINMNLMENLKEQSERIY